MLHTCQDTPSHWIPSKFETEGFDETEILCRPWSQAILDHKESCPCKYEPPCHNSSLYGLKTKSYYSQCATTKASLKQIFPSPLYDPLISTSI